jgi:hypothetical protein
MVWRAAGRVPCLLSLCVCLCRRLSAACRLPCPGLRCIACTHVVVAFLTSPSPLEHLYPGYLPYSICCPEHGTAEPSCGVKTSIRLVFRFGLQQSPGARYSCCRSQSAAISTPRAPFAPHHQHHHLPRHHHHLLPSLSLYRAQPVAIIRPLRKPASGPTSIRYNLHRLIRASAKRSHLYPRSLSRKPPTGTITCTVGVCRKKALVNYATGLAPTPVILEAVAGRTLDISFLALRPA